MKGPTKQVTYICNNCKYLTSKYDPIEHWPEYHCNHPTFTKPIWVENPKTGLSKLGCPEMLE